MSIIAPYPFKEKPCDCSKKKDTYSYLDFLEISEDGLFSSNPCYFCGSKIPISITIAHYDSQDSRKIDRVKASDFKTVKDLNFDFYSCNKHFCSDCIFEAISKMESPLKSTTERYFEKIITEMRILSS